MRTSTSLVLLVTLAAAAFAFVPALTDTPDTDAPPVERSAMEGYEDMWKKVEEALGNGLPKTALAVVEKIYARAKAEGNEPQYIKATAYRVALLAQTTDEGELVLIGDLEREITAAREPARAIFQSMLADLYWGYYQMHRWQIGQRTQVAERPADDFRTWDARKFFDTTRALYHASLSRSTELRRIPVQEYAYILHRQSRSELYRPTLYDVLAHRALEFFANDETDLPKPEREFSLDSLDGFAPAETFAAHAFATPDESDAVWQALRLFQDLTRAHLGDPAPDALADLELQRLAFIRRKCVHEDRDTAYFEALEALYERVRSSSISSEVGCAMAQYVFDTGDYVRARARCEREEQRWPDSRGAVNCAALRSRIEHKGLAFAVEATVPPDRPFVLSTAYRNLPRAFFRVLRWDEDLVDGRYYDYERYHSTEEWLRDVVKRPAFRTWTADVPATGDYKEHRTDLAGPELPLGRYLVLASARADFAVDGNEIDFAFLAVTRLSLQSQQTSGGDIRCTVQDAVSGKPLRGVSVELYDRQWNSSGRHYQRDRIATLETDDDGGFVMHPQERGNVYVVLRNGDDRYDVERAYYPYRRSAPSPGYRTLFFTDRSLYRPGQTIAFKGIVIRQDPAKVEYAAAKDVSTTVTLYDVNRQKVAEHTFTTNEFGSFNGTFTAPSGVLTGVMTIANGWGSTNVRVEEYKRPKFEALFDPIKDTPRLGETVTAHGHAKAYAGNVVDGAGVTYRVVRRVFYPFWWWWWRPMPGGGEKEIAHGKTTTDETGAFAVPFVAVPDRSVRKKDLPTFSYTVYADVTDVNGETHSATYSVSMAYTAIQLGVAVDAHVERGMPSAIAVTTTNANGMPVAAKGTVVVERLRPPERLERPRLLPKPDEFAMTERAFHESFPQDVYRDEDIEDTWPVARKEIAVPFATNGTDPDSIGVDRLEPGRYRVTVTAPDPSGETLSMKTFFTVYERAASEPPVSARSFYVPLALSGQPGDTATFLWGTSYEDARVRYQVEHRGTLIRDEWLTVSNGMRRFAIPIRENMRGGMSARLMFVRDGRLVAEEIAISVPWTNKDLTVETSTFRDKLHPGDREEWRMVIRGARADAVAAEVVATMYDASLDAIWRRDWSLFAWPSFWSGARFDDASFHPRTGERYEDDTFNDDRSGYPQYYDELNLFILGNSGYGGRYFHAYDMMKSGRALRSDEAAANMAAPAAQMEAGGLLAVADEKKERDSQAAAPPVESPPKPGPDLAAVRARTNFNETAFFSPALRTDDSGAVVLSFTAPEALTRWRLMAFAHTPDLCTGYLERTAVTQKELMVVPNAPRFLREGDRIVFPVKISNLSDSALAGTARLALFDAVTMAPVDARYDLTDADRPFRVEKGRSTSVSWSLSVPEGVGAVTYRVVARAGAFSDGEEAALPVLANRMLVTETLPLTIRGKETKTFAFEKLLRSGASPTLRSARLTLEMTSNPAWYAVQALPYLMEYPYECSEQVFNRYYANAIAAHIVHSNPKIARVFARWKGTEALASNLEKNAALKAVLLEETPWVLQARDERERKERIALLFDLGRMAGELETALGKLEKKQGSNGGWPWFAGMPESRHLTQYILAGFGHLHALGVSIDGPRPTRMIASALRYCDEEMGRAYESLKRTYGTLDPEKHWLNEVEIQYLYARSFFPGTPIPEDRREAVAFWRDQARRYWTRYPLLPQAMIALAAHRNGEKALADRIIKSFGERSLHSDELGMYWKQDAGWYWYQAPIETQALLVEAFAEIAHDGRSVEEMKIWLLKQKQVQDWGTTTATADACYAILLRGEDLLASDALVEVEMGGRRVDPSGDGREVEAGTGHYQATWSGTEITPSLGTIAVHKTDTGIAWGAVYWQYYERLDRITAHATPLSIEKRLYRRTTTERGEALDPVTAEHPLRVGDAVTVRIEIRVDRAMEYVHLKDMRGAGLEPIGQLSRCRWQGDLCYYEAPRDASTNFFIGWLPKGVHVFEYTVRASHAGRFANGISTIQCMYAPEFAAHTAGETVTIAEN